MHREPAGSFQPPDHQTLVPELPTLQRIVAYLYRQIVGPREGSDLRVRSRAAC